MRKKTFALTRNKQVFFAVYQIIITFAREEERGLVKRREEEGKGSDEKRGYEKLYNNVCYDKG